MRQLMREVMIQIFILRNMNRKLLMINMPNLNFITKRMIFLKRSGLILCSKMESCIYKISRKMTLSLQILKTVSRYLTRKDRHLMHKMLIILNIIFQGLTKRKMQDFHSGRYGIWRWQILRH